MAERKRRRIGRPPLPMPDPIPDTPENVARAIMRTRPMKDHEWRYLRESPAKYDPELKEGLTRAERRRAMREGREGAQVIDRISYTCPN